MFYSYESGGRVSRPVFDYRTEVLSGSFAARSLESFKFIQGPAVPLSDISGTLAQYADRSIYNLSSQRSGLGVLSGAQSSQQQVPEGYVLHQAGPVYTWTTDELGGNTDANRIFQPAPSRILFFNNAEETKSYSYHPAIIDLYTEVDFGSITANATTVSNNGQVADLNATLVDYGRIYYVTNVESFGFSKTLDAASWKACSAWVGEGNLISFGKQTSPAVYGIITDGKVKLSGAADVNYSPASDGRGILPLQGTLTIEFAAAIAGSGRFTTLSGAAISFTTNPDEKQILFSVTGERISEKITNNYFGDGTLFNLSNVITRRSYDYVGSGTINLVSAKPDQINLKDIADLVLEDIKDRLLSTIKWEPSDEKKTDDYNESSKVIWSTRDFGNIAVCNTQEIISGDVSGQATTGCTIIVEPNTTARVVLGQTYQTAVDDNAPSEYIDWGTITFPAAMSQDWGNILDQELRPQGLIRFDESQGAASKFMPNWIGRGGLRLSGEAMLPVFANEYATGIIAKIGGSAKTNFSLLQPAEGLFRIISESEFNLGVKAEGSGTFRKFSGSAESIGFNPIETQMLFSFTGAYTDLKFTYGTYSGDGRLFNVSGGEERGTNSYVGSGEIKVRSDKPEQLDLKKLADTKLSDIRNRWLGSLKWELSDEKHTENYNFSAFVPSVDLDYGLIVDPNNVVVTTITTQTVTSDETGATGVIRVGLNEVVTLAATYTIPSVASIPSTTIDHGLVSDIHSPTDDYGWILGTHAHGIPFGTVADITGTAGTPRVRTHVADGGLFRITGKALLPLFASVWGGGLFKPQGASKTNFSLLAIGDGHINGMYGNGEESVVTEYFGDGSLRKFGGGAESSTWNPTEKQMLFSFTGGYTDLKFTHGTWHGSGRIKNFATLRAERTSYDWVGSGTIITWNKLEEARTVAYNCSSIVEFQDLNYGFLVDPSTIPVTSLTTQTISDVTAPTGHVRVEQGEVVTLDGTYSVPTQSTTPTEFIDHNILLESEDLLLDHGHILDTVAMGQPACIYGEIDITGTGETPRTFKETGDGRLFRLRGVARVPLDAKEYGTGLFKPQGASITNFSLLAIGGGHIPGMYGNGAESTATEWFGEGRFSTFSGAAEVVAFNPDEKQMLFSFSGAYSSLSFTHGTWQGDGRLFNIGGGAQRVAYDYVGSGSILTFNKLEEARTYFYNCSSIVPFLDLDYGLVVDSSSVPITDLSTQTISSDETAPTGIIRVGFGEVVTLGASYTIPSTQTIPTDFIDYNLVNESEDELLDFGHIHDSVQMGMPACIYGTIEIRGAADTIFSPDVEGTGLYAIGGSAHTTISVDHIGSGDLFAFSGAGEILSVAIEGTGLFRIGDEADPAIVKAYIGSGTFRKFSGAAESLTFNPEEKQMLFSFIGTSGDPVITLAHEGSGNLFAFDGSGERETNAWYGSGIITLTSKKPRLDEPSEEKHTEVYDLNIDCYQPEYDYGSLVDAALVNCTPTSGLITTDTTASSGCAILDGTFGIYPGSTYTIPLFVNTPSSLYDYGTVPDPEEGTPNYGWILDPLGKHCPFGQIHHVRGTSVNTRTFREVFTGESEHKVYGINISGDAEIVVPPQWYGYGVLKATSREISITGFSLRTFGSGRLFGMGGGAESVSVSEGGQVLFKFVPGPFDRWTTYDWQPSWVTRGFIRGATGEAKTHYVPHVEGTGYIPVFNGAAESITVNPEERQLLFSFTGEHQVSFTANPPEDTARVKIGSLADTRFIPKYPGDGQILTSGIAKTHWVPHIIGTGYIPVFNGAAESLTVNPEERQMLFSFIGERLSEKKSVTEIGSGDILVTGLSTQLLTFAEQPFGTTSVFGEGYITSSLKHVGSGTFRKFGGGAESVTVNPEERQLLFSFTGELSEKTSVTEIGSGILFGFSGASETFTAAYETQGLYRISGDGHITASLLHVGSGTFRKFGGGAESLTVNPDERQLLFSFTGEGSQSLTVAETKQIEIDITGTAEPVLRTQAFHGSGTISVTGDARIHYVPHVIGTGFIPVFAGAAESITVNPDEKQMLFSFMGESQERILVRAISESGTIDLAGTSGDPLLTFAEQGEGTIPVSGDGFILISLKHFGSGSFRKFGGSAEAVAFNPEDRQVLFNFIGDATQKVAKDYVGSGTFRKLSGAAEAVSFNPEERQMLFSFAGAGTDSRTAREIGTGTLSTTGEAGVLIRFAHDGEGTIPISGEAHTTRARDFVGFGTVPTFSGAAESTTFNPTERDMLFSVIGERISEKITARELSQGGTLVVGSTSGDPLLTFAEQPHIEIAVSGDSYDIRTRAYQGSGRIKNFHSLDEAFALAPYIGSGRFSISGAGFVQVQLFQPPHAQVWII